MMSLGLVRQSPLRFRVLSCKTSDALYDLARAVCDRYWAKFQMKNRSQAHLPEDKRQLGRFAPFVRRHPANGKIYIRWRNYHPSRTGARGKKVFGVDVPPLKTGHYQPSQFWSSGPSMGVNLIIKTEHKSGLCKTTCTT